MEPLKQMQVLAQSAPVEGLGKAVKAVDDIPLAKFGVGVGMGVEAFSAIAGARAASATGRFQSKLYKQQATQARAAGSRQAEEEGRQTRLVQSRAEAVAAASGGGSVPGLIADIAKEGEYRALDALFQGEQTARNLLVSADSAMLTGRNRRTAGFLRAGTSLIRTAPSLMEKYSGPTS